MCKFSWQSVEGLQAKNYHSMKDYTQGNQNLFRFPKLIHLCLIRNINIGKSCLTIHFFKLFLLKIGQIYSTHQYCHVKCCFKLFDKGSLDLIPSPSPSVKIQIMGGKVHLRCKGKTLLAVVNKLFVFKSLLTSPSNVFPYCLK